MPPQQQRFWPDPQPLVERLGRDFFRQLPEKPGVYLMHGAADLVLYVGKAKSLRHRLGNYRVANPERMNRRTLRLLRLVERIAWEECSDELAAIRREAELLLTLKPRFNRAGVWQGPKRFLAWRSQHTGLELAVVDSLEDGWNGAGPFGAQAMHIHRALVRLFWCRFHPDPGLAGMPAGWFHGEHGTRVLLPVQGASLPDEASRLLIELTNGEAQKFPKWMPPPSPYEQPIRDEDLEFVTKHLAGSWNQAQPASFSQTSSSSVSEH
ncbi:MAG: nucleotide excision repair endonuclease [Verrucomicrobiales bacterium]|nr:nucleotide excision repair endonuclease [Verrucomicrobiales bacterium]